MDAIRTVSDVAHVVRGRRMELGLSQAELARQASVSRKWVYEFEAGQPAAELRKILAVADALGLALAIGPAAPESDDVFDLDAHLADYTAG
jgi:HTH-type transcriptional regulator / antitoxin HipB